MLGVAVRGELLREIQDTRVAFGHRIAVRRRLKLVSVRRRQYMADIVRACPALSSLLHSFPNPPS